MAGSSKLTQLRDRLPKRLDTAHSLSFRQWTLLWEDVFCRFSILISCSLNNTHSLPSTLGLVSFIQQLHLAVLYLSGEFYIPSWNQGKQHTFESECLLEYTSYIFIANIYQFVLLTYVYLKRKTWCILFPVILGNLQKHSWLMLLN